MKKALFGLVLIGLIGFTACEPDDDKPADKTPQLSFVFTPYFNDIEVQVAQRFTNEDGYPIAVHNLAFYLSNMELIREDGTALPLSDIEIIDLRNMHRTLTFEIPAGEYAGLRFDLGVPSELNSPANPEFSIGAFDADHPLSESNGMFWDWQGGYRFFSFDGHCDTVPNTAEFLPLSFGLHSGQDTLYRVLPDFDYPFQITHSDMKVISFGINLNTLFQNGDSHIDLKYDRQFHGSPNMLGLGIKIANNSAASFEIRN